MNQYCIVPGWVLALLVISLLLLSEVQVAELETGRVILVQLVLPDSDELYSTLSLTIWVQERRSNQAAGKY